MKYREPIPTSTVVKYLRVCGLTSEEISEFICALDKMRDTVGDMGYIKDLSISVNDACNADVEGPKPHPGEYATDTYIAKNKEVSIYYRFRYS